jgi:hypothetical protein
MIKITNIFIVNAKKIKNQIKILFLLLLIVYKKYLTEF